MAVDQGKTLEQLAADGWSVVPVADKSNVAPSGAVPRVSARAGVPAVGRGTQLDLGKSQQGAATVVNAATTPLVNTGSSTADSLTTPVALASLAIGGTAIGRAIGAPALTAVERAIAGLGATAEQVTPLLKFEVTRRTLHAAGVPEWLAVPASVMISGYKKGPKAAATEAEAANAAKEATTAATSQAAPAAAPVARPAAPVTAAPPAEPIAPPAPASPASPASAPPPALDTAGQPAITARPPNGLPNQKAINELAIQARRAKVKLTGDELQAGISRIEQGQSAADAVKAVMDQRLADDPAAKLAALLSSPTDAEVQAALAARVAKGEIKGPIRNGPVLTPARMAELQAKFGGRGR